MSIDSTSNNISPCVSMIFCRGIVSDCPVKGATDHLLRLLRLPPGSIKTNEDKEVVIRTLHLASGHLPQLEHHIMRTWFRF